MRLPGPWGKRGTSDGRVRAETAFPRHLECYCQSGHKSTEDACENARQTDARGEILRQGLLFITVFNAIGWVTQNVSVATSMVAAKMSVIIPLLFAVWVLGESMNLMKLSGILLSLAALYFVVGRNEEVHGKGFSVIRKG